MIPSPTAPIGSPLRPHLRRARRRFRAGAILTAVGIILTIIWVQSRWWYRAYETPTRSAALMSGVLTLDFQVTAPVQASLAPSTNPPPGAAFRGVGWVSFYNSGGPLRWYWLLNPPLFEPTKNSPLEPYRVSLLGLIETYRTSTGPWNWAAPGGLTSSAGGVPVRVIRLVLWPLAFIPLATGLAFLACAWRTKRRILATLNPRCPRCGYPSRGLGAAAICPECGVRSKTIATT
ncbi:hypothetical protein BH11PLA1_BH11PLA1_18070 [soil metagenome]